ncbi:hypothetical protein AB0N09_42375 [Streptomyces erythrochromogenes]|uniref:hypothetical protein n=1 Tax=Streptomyces erythrochromogenes TaxID=285574 RepID=UPI00343D612D
MTAPIPEPHWYDTWESMRPLAGFDDYALEEAWRLFEGHLDTSVPALHDGPGESTENPGDGLPAIDSEKVAAALDATWASMDQVDAFSCDMDEVRPWLARTLLDAAIPAPASPQPAVLDVLTEIACSPHGADAWYPTAPAVPDTAPPWSEGPESAHGRPDAYVQHGWQPDPQWDGQWQPGPHPLGTAAFESRPLPTGPAEGHPLDPAYPDGLSLPMSRHAPVRPVDILNAHTADRARIPAPQEQAPAYSADVGPPYDNSELTPTQTKILAVIRNTNADNPAKIAEGAGCTPSTADTYLRRMAPQLHIWATAPGEIIKELRRLLRSGRLSDLPRPCCPFGLWADSGLIVLARLVLRPVPS